MVSSLKGGGGGGEGGGGRGRKREKKTKKKTQVTKSVCKHLKIISKGPKYRRMSTKVVWCGGVGGGCGGGEQKRKAYNHKKEKSAVCIFGWLNGYDSDVYLQR